MLLPQALIVLTLFCLVAAPLQAAKPHAAAAQVPASIPPSPQPVTETLPLAYLGQQAESLPAPPFFDPFVPNQGVQGARLAIQDDNTTGRFTRQHFELHETLLPADADAITAFQALMAKGYQHILVRLAPAVVKQLAALPEARHRLIYDIATQEDPLTAEACQPNVLKLMPSRAMRADALAQYLLKKRWSRWFLVVGPNDGDQHYAAAIKRAAQRYGARIVAEKLWQHHFDERRTPESEIPVFTQGDDHDVLVVADEFGVFGDSLSYRSWHPRPVVGTQGLKPTNWHRTHEAWGALQLQHRFKEQAGYEMTETDYAAWLAVRAVGEAATRTRSVQFEPIKAYLLGNDLALAGFKGVPLSFRA
ncbi:MAG: branched-chain amino acid ABC transporter substrate-binding protein, partial [Methylococcaceae bacterium]